MGEGTMEGKQTGGGLLSENAGERGRGENLGENCHWGTRGRSLLIKTNKGRETLR